MDKVKTTLARGCAVTLILSLALPALAQDDMIKRRDEKLNESWVKKAAWITDFDKAREAAKDSGKPIFAYFTRSYSVCPYCYRLEASVFGEDVIRTGWEERLPDAETRAKNLKEFQEWSKNCVLFLHVTSRVEGDKYQKLASRRGSSGFPYLAFLDANGDLLAGRVSRDVKSFEFSLNKAREVKQELDDLAKRSEAGDKEADKLRFFKKVELLHFSAAKARQAMEGLGLSADEKKKAEAELVDLDIREVMLTLTLDEKTRIAAGSKFAEMKEDGRIPSAPQKTEWRYFYHFIMIYAESEKNVKLFEDALETWKKQYGSNPRQQNSIKALEAKLAELKSEGS